jgi:hypothetical protein
MEEVKKHPVPAALIAGGVVFGFLYITGAFSSSSAAATTSGGLDPATAQLYAQSEAVQAQQQEQTQGLQAQQDLATTQASYGLSLAQIQANAQTTQTNTAASVSLAQISADAQTSQESVAASLQAAQDQIGVTTDSINASLAGLEDTNQTTVNIAALTAGEQEDIAQITGNTQVALSNNQTQYAIAASNNNTAAVLGVAGDSASVAKTQSTNSLIGSLAGSALGAAAIFSDVRLKENVRHHHTDADGVRWFEFNYRGNSVRHVGVKAHEVPEFAALDPSGYLKVDYRALRKRKNV